ncbi:MAG TPA: copper chaperone PCu(A)C [Hyphomicrobiales bacterium]|nr:copper chaperone PCu(A)C [Hyphomicrobiales bacterium]
MFKVVRSRLGGMLIPLAAALVLIGIGIVLAHAAPAGPITIAKPWMRATPGGATVGAGYLTITNVGPTADRLVAVSTPAAASVTQHRTVEEGGTSRMVPIVGGMEIPPGKTVTFAPSGAHLMLMGLKAPLKAGEHVPVTLTFQHAGALTTDFVVEGIGASAPSGAMDMSHMPGMDHMSGMGGMAPHH